MENQKAKYYSLIAIGVSTFFFGPLAGAYMMRKNFLLLGNKAAADKTVLAIIFSAILLCVYITSPDETGVAGFAPFVSLIVVITLSHMFQKKDLDEYARSGGKKYSFGRIIVTGVIAAVVTLVYLFALIIYFNPAIY